MAGTSGVVATQVFAANGLYDPDITGSGHQPMGFDQLMLSYNHYTVTEARLICTFHNLVTTSSPIVSVKVDGSATPITVVDQILEWGLNTHSTLEAKGTFGSTKVLEGKVKIARFEGVDDVLDVIDLRGSVAANPAELTYFHVQTWDNSSTTTSILVEFVLEFSAVFTEPRVLSESLRQLLSKQLIVEEKRSQHDTSCGSRRVT